MKKLILALFLMTTGVEAQELVGDSLSAVPATIMKAPTETNGPARADIDQEITNARLRAATGSKSLLSVQSTLNYNGGSIQEPLGQTRPQLSPGTVENDPAKLTGTVSAKYRASDHDNINLGVGVGWLTPAYQGQRGQIEDPYAGYSRVFKAGSIQNVLNTQITKYTADSSVQNGLNYELEADHTILSSIGKTKLQLGLDVAWSREFYTSLGGVQDELAAYPFLEYEFTKSFSFRTVYRGLTYFNTTQAASTFTHDDSTQSMGVGISVARDIYLYPNVQWVWGDMRPEKTNVALAANINLF